MIRKIVIPRERTYLLELSETFVGKEVEVLAFEVEETAPQLESPSSQSDRLEKIREAFSKYQVDISSYKFDRDEANNYE